MDVAAQVDLRRISTRQHRRFVRHVNAQGVEVVSVTQFEAFLLQTAGQNIGQTVNAAGDAFQANRTMEHRIQAGNVSQQNLRGTNVRAHGDADA